MCLVITPKKKKKKEWEERDLGHRLQGNSDKRGRTMTTLGTIAFAHQHPSSIHIITHQTHSGNKPNARHHMALQGDQGKKKKEETE